MRHQSLYLIIYRNEGMRVCPAYPDKHVVLERADTLEEARDKRFVSGDLVVWADSLKPVQDPAWLWDWERARGMESYAYRAYKSGQ